MPGSTRRMTGHSMSRKTAPEPMPRFAEDSQYSGGMRSSAASRKRAASGRLKKTWAMRMPASP
ncbi:MAG: hypothetical protein BGO06_06620 [Shinella sp. 65-6]|nr:MAG: hypothetical protein BGO06_06620 [Shinella sp. 65-6]